MNALKHGPRSRATILRFRRIRNALRLAAENLLRIKVILASRHPRIRYKQLARLREAVRISRKREADHACVTARFGLSAKGLE